MFKFNTEYINLINAVEGLKQFFVPKKMKVVMDIYF